MSRNTNTNTKTAATTFKKCCQFCMNIGKTEAEYTSHFTRESHDINSKVVCPELLALNCRYCLKSGHTVKYCPDIKKKNKQLEKESKVRQLKAQVQAPSKAKLPAQAPKNRFASLDDSSEDDIEEKNEFPPLCANIKTQKVFTGYATALTTVKSKPSNTVFEVKPKPELKVVENSAKPAPWASAATTKMDTKNSWAAFDSDEEEDVDFDSQEEHELYGKEFDLEDSTW